jgi:hypothetical protein
LVLSSVTSKAQCISPGALPNAGSQVPNGTTVPSHQTQHPSTRWASSGRRCAPVAVVHHVVAKRARAVHSTSICKTECASRSRGIGRFRGADKCTLPGTLDARPMQIVRGETEPAGAPSSSCGTSTCRAAVSPAESPSIMLDARRLCQRPCAAFRPWMRLHQVLVSGPKRFQRGRVHILPQVLQSCADNLTHREFRQAFCSILLLLRFFQNRPNKA